MIDSNNKVNIMILAYIAKLDLFIKLTNIKAQKIDSLILKINEIVAIRFLIKDKEGKN